MKLLQSLWCIGAVTLLLTIAPLPARADAGKVRDDTLKILEAAGGTLCPDSEFTCITLSVPLDHFDANNHSTLDVKFAILPATGTRKGMFVTATGGPGTAGTTLADSYTSLFRPALTEHFDIVFFDQRGVGLSGGLNCPVAATQFYLSDLRAETPAQEAHAKKVARRFSDSCLTEKGSPNFLQFVGTRQAVEDLEQFRAMIGDDKFWLYGESYGTQYSQTYAAAHPKHLAGLILDGTVDLTLSGTDFYVQETQAFNDTLASTLKSCQTQAACSKNFGVKPLCGYDQLAARLKGGSLPLNFPLSNGKVAKRKFTFADLETAVAGQVYNESDRMMLERALAAAEGRQDLAPLARLEYLTLGVDPKTLAVIPDPRPSYSDGAFYAIECQDYGYFAGTPDQRADQYLTAGNAVDFSIPRLVSIFYGDLPCTYWQGSSQSLNRPPYISATGIPTLVLGATADPATPGNNGISVYHHLADGYLVTQQGGPHVIFGRGVPCPDNLVTQFLVNDFVPANRESTCPGVVADSYVPLAPVDARDFKTPLEAMASAENEIFYLPEFYYWDGTTPTGTGCTYGGTIRFAPQGDLAKFDLQECAFSRGFEISGEGTYDYASDHFKLKADVTGQQTCHLTYDRVADRAKLKGSCAGKRADVDTTIAPHETPQVHHTRLFHRPIRARLNRLP